MLRDILSITKQEATIKPLMLIHSVRRFGIPQVEINKPVEVAPRALIPLAHPKSLADAKLRTGAEEDQNPLL